MPCIPSWHEQLWMRLEHRFQALAPELRRLVAELTRALPVVEDAVLSAPSLRRPGAQDWVKRARELLDAARPLEHFDAMPQTDVEVDARAAAVDGLGPLVRDLEQHLCEGGVLVQLATTGTAPLERSPPALDPVVVEPALPTPPRTAAERARAAHVFALQRRVAELQAARFAVRDAAREAVFARHEYFDSAIDRDDAITAEAGAALRALDAEQAAVEAELARCTAMPLAEFEATRGARDEFLARHRAHRESDRQAKLAELRAALARADGAEQARLRAELERIEALTAEQLASSRDLF